MKRINLLPVVWRDQREQRYARRLAWVSLCAAVPIFVMLGAFWFVRSSKMSGDMQVQRTRLTELTKQTEQLKQLVTEQDRLEQEMRDRQALVPQVRTTQTMALLIMCLPEQAGLTRMVIDTPMPTVSIVGGSGQNGQAAGGVKKTETLVAAAPQKLQLQGYAADDMAIADYMNRLGGRPLFSAVKLGMSREVRIGDKPLHEFYVTMDVPMNREFVVRAEHE